ncbi:hypothetical protein [Chryseobacterium lineare]
MRTNLDLSCEELKKELVTIIENADCDSELLIGIKYYLNLYLNDPIFTYESDKERFVNACNTAQIKIKDEFIIDKKLFNKIIGENWDKRFMHIFFIDDNGDLSLLFRFSDIETFNASNIKVDLNMESAYTLKEGEFTKLDRYSPDFDNISARYKSGVGSKIELIQNSLLTEYITYSMKKIFLFNGFEDDVRFEVICIEDQNRKNRLTLCAYIKDSDRIHHIDAANNKVYEGYYDLGNLKP